MSTNGWVGVDLDGTLAFYDGWKGIEHIGTPIPEMVKRVKGELERENGYEIKIFTARVACNPPELHEVIMHIDAWCKQVFGRTFEVTNVKDMMMVSCWDDRAVEIVPNTGMVAHEVEYQRGLREGAETATWTDGDQFFKNVASLYTEYYQHRRTNPQVNEMLTFLQQALDTFGAKNPKKYGYGMGNTP